MQCDIDCLITQEPSAPVSIDRKVTEMTSRRRDTSRLCQHFENNFRVCELVSFASRRTGGPDLSWLLHTVSLMASRKATEIMDPVSIALYLEGKVKVSSLAMGINVRRVGLDS